MLAANLIPFSIHSDDRWGRENRSSSLLRTSCDTNEFTAAPNYFLFDLYNDRALHKNRRISLTPLFPLSEHKPINVGFSCLPALLDENENLARGVLLLDLTEVEVVGVQVRRLEQR